MDGRTGNKPDQPIAVSVITLFPFSWGPWGPWFLGRFHRRTGFRLQLVPFFGWRRASLAKHLPADAVVSFEGSWCSHETPAQVIRHAGRIGFIALLNALLFGFRRHSDRKIRWFRELYANAFAVDLEGVGKRELVEVTPERKGYVYRTPVVLDLWHYREFKNPPSIPENLIHLIHFQTRRIGDFKAFLAGVEGNRLETDLHFLLPKDRCVPIVIEIPPQWLFFGLRLRLLEKLRQRLKEIH